MVQGNSGKPLYARVRDKLSARIASGDWAPGVRLPGEHALCREFQVSRITVRQALRELEDEGLIERRQGRGTTVRARQFEQRLSSMYSFSEELKKLGAAPTAAVLDFKAAEASEDVAARLGIAPGAPVYAVKRLRSAAGQPFAAEISYLPQALARGLTEAAVAEKGLYLALRECAGVYPRQAEETLSAVALPREFAVALGEKRGAPAMLVERVAFWRGAPVEYCKSWVRADRFKFKVNLGVSRQ
jgi:GntR family transcriptional regulator